MAKRKHTPGSPRLWYFSKLNLYEFTVKIPMYKLEVVVLVGPYKSLKERVAARHNNPKLKEGLADHGSYSGLSFFISDGADNPVQQYLWMEEWTFSIQDIATLSHEAVHVALRLLGHVGIAVGEPDNSEPLAYLQDHLLETSLRVLLENGVNTDKRRRK